MMKWYQTQPNVLKNSVSCSHYKWPYYLWSDQALGFIFHPNRHGDGGSVLPGDCVSDPSVEGKQKEGGGAEGSPGITAELRDKRDIVALTDPSKKTLLPVPSDPASSAHELLTSQNWKSLFNIICCSTLGTNQMQTLALKHSYLWRNLHPTTFKLTCEIF